LRRRGPGDLPQGHAGLHARQSRDPVSHFIADRHAKRDAGGDAFGRADAIIGAIAISGAFPGSVPVTGSVGACRRFAGTCRRFAGTVSITGWNRRWLTTS
jgi:hypothetical protein